MRHDSNVLSSPSLMLRYTTASKRWIIFPHGVFVLCGLKYHEIIAKLTLAEVRF